MFVSLHRSTRCAGLLVGTAVLLCAPQSHATSVATKPPIFVLNSGDATVSVIDPVTFTERTRVPTGKEPHHLYLTPDQKSLLVANALSDSLTLLDPATGQVQRVLRGIDDPYQLRFSPDMKWFVTAGNRLDQLAIYRWIPQDLDHPLQLAARVPAPKTPSHLAIDGASRTLYTTLQDSDELIAVDLATQKIKWKRHVGHQPADLFPFADDRKLLVALTGDRVVEVYDLTHSPPTLIKRLPTGEGAHAFRAQGDGHHVFVSNRAADTISRIDLDTISVVDTYPAPGGPDCMDVSANGRTLFVTSRWARKLTLIDLAQHKVARQVEVGRSPHGVWTLDHAALR
jgi:YVTN family beta-propeller protein